MEAAEAAVDAAAVEAYRAKRKVRRKARRTTKWARMEAHEYLNGWRRWVLLGAVAASGAVAIGIVIAGKRRAARSFVDDEELYVGAEPNRSPA